MSASNPVRASALVLGSAAVALLGSVICVGLSGILRAPSAQTSSYPEPSPGIPISRPAETTSQPAETASRPQADADAAPAASTESRPVGDTRPASRTGSASRTAAATVRDPFFLPEERAAGTTLAAMWQRSDDDAAARRTAAENAAAEAAALAARIAAAGAVAPPPANLISETDLAAARALRVRGIVRSPDGVWVVLATGRYTVGEQLPELPFVIDAVLADSVVLRAGAATVHLPITRPGSRPGAVKAIQ